MVEIHLFVIPWWICDLYILAVAAVAAWKGDWRARAIAFTQALLMIGWFPFCRPGYCFLPPALPPIVTDTVMLTVCVACVWRAERYWTIWVTSLTLLALITDLSSGLPGVTFWAWRSASLILSMAGSATILWGVWTSVRAARAKD